MRLRRSRPDQAGFGRRRRGRGFGYVDADGNVIDDTDVLERIRTLAIPPAWEDVWICPYPNGHIQAVGTDQAGRRQYLYHDDWRVAQDADKHDRVRQLARKLPLSARRSTRTWTDVVSTGARSSGWHCGCSTTAFSGPETRSTPRNTAAVVCRRCCAATYG